MNTKILIVDDDPDFVTLTEAVLRSKGYEVEVAYDGEQALNRMTSAQGLPDVVLLDVMMAWPLEGVSVSRDMMRNTALQSIPIIMVTSIRDSEYREIFPQDEYLHIDAWLDKPCSPETLIREIEAVLARHQRYANTV